MQLFSMALAEWTVDNEELAVPLLEESAALTRAGAADTVFGQVLSLLAASRVHTEPVEALELLREAIEYDHHGGLRRELAAVLARGAQIFGVLGHTEAALVIVGAASHSLAGLYQVPPREREAHARAIDSFRVELGDASDQAIARGAAMTYDEIIEYTLNELDHLLADDSASINTLIEPDTTP
jgi:hypothetical protein